MITMLQSRALATTQRGISNEATENAGKKMPNASLNAVLKKLKINRDLLISFLNQTVQNIKWDKKSANDKKRKRKRKKEKSYLKVKIQLICSSVIDTHELNDRKIF